MAFVLATFDKLSASGVTGLPILWAYESSTDLLATIAASGYFNAIDYSLSIGDYLYVKGSDGSNLYGVTAVSPNVTIAANPDVVAPDSIVNADINTAAAIAYSKLATMATGSILAGNAGVPTATVMSGDATIGATGVVTIANLAITNAKVSASAAIAFSKLAALTDGHILVGSALNVATDVAVSGDVTLSNAGLVTIANNAVTSAKTSPLMLKYASVAITAAEFNGMYAAPKLLLAAGGANTLHVFEQLQLLMTYVSANYAAGGVVAVQYDSTANGAGVIASTTLAAATFQAAASTGFNFNRGVVAETFTTCVNKGLYLSNITGAFTTGDSTFVAHLWYRTIPTV